ncbi:nucleoside diphosphate kinase regulator [Noviherbaspirillum sp.]|uniref:nucleoside diphosphate kinase regulator n=1 Tax=Noviherbaspirillum sp. TaxID=1926288 RepID=UPI002B48A0CB|nr:nucleoside diphosphate kinase regulator [Noviherbaspirillum sp.]HJV82355.1 nucleoside diphosphate kinase regulator [Noviherbaspirillum sp.]
MKPDIIVTTADIDRLESLIEAMPPLSDAAEELLDELQRAEVVEPHELPGTVVTMDSIVRFTLGPRGEEFCRRLVYPRQATDASTISVLSPVGSALLGLSVGSSIEWPGPTGERLLIRVVDVVHQPESAEAG